MKLAPNGCLARAALVVGCAALAAACGGRQPEPEAPAPAAEELPPPLPDTSGWGVHVLAMERAPDGALWVGSYGQGIYVLRPGTRVWENIQASDDEPASISWGLVNAFAFPADGSVWYGTVGNGFGRSADGGRTWRNWTFEDLGPEWQYVAPNGIRARGDTVWIATADGLRATADSGVTWSCVQGVGAPPGGAEGHDDRCAERSASLPTEYLLSLDVGPDGSVWVGHLQGLSVSRDAGATWRHLGEGDGIPRVRIRGVSVDGGRVWAVTELRLYEGDLATGRFDLATVRSGYTPPLEELPGAPRAVRGSVARGGAAIAMAGGLLAPDPAGSEVYRHYVGTAGQRATDTFALLWPAPPRPPLAGTALGLNAYLEGQPLLGDYARPPCRVEEVETARGPQRVRRCHAPTGDRPVPMRHRWLQRSIASAEGNPFIDQTYRYGSTMGGNFQQHQGVEFNNPAGTPVRAAADGTVIHAGPAEAGALTVAIAHDREWDGRKVVTTYYHNSELRVSAGQRVRAGQVIALVGNTGRATNDHLHLEVHVGPDDEPSRYVDPEQRFPPHTVNPQLWLEPIPGTGVVAGRVFDARGEPVPGARVYGLVVDYPAETPFSFAETYEDRAHPDPAYGEHFAVGDVGEGRYIMGVEVEGRPIWRRVTVEAGKLTWVVFRPDAERAEPEGGAVR